MNCFSMSVNSTTSPPLPRGTSGLQPKGIPERLLKLIESIVVEGRKAGEFERKTPLDEATLAIYMVMCPFINPVQLQYNLEAAPTAAVVLTSLILRSLAPD